MVHLIYIPKKLGRRGTYLVGKGAVWMIYGIGIIGYPPKALFDLPFIDNRIHTTIAGSIWVLCGLTAILSARSLSPIGFYALAFPAAVWAVEYLLGFIDSLIPQFGRGAPAGWSGFLIFGLFAGIVLVVAGMVDVDEVAPMRPQRR